MLLGRSGRRRSAAAQRRRDNRRTVRIRRVGQPRPECRVVRRLRPLRRTQRWRVSLLRARGRPLPDRRVGCAARREAVRTRLRGDRLCGKRAQTAADDSVAARCGRHARQLCAAPRRRPSPPREESRRDRFLARRHTRRHVPRRAARRMGRHAVRRADVPRLPLLRPRFHDGRFRGGTSQLRLQYGTRRALLGRSLLLRLARSARNLPPQMGRSAAARRRTARRGPAGRSRPPRRGLFPETALPETALRRLPLPADRALHPYLSRPCRLMGAAVQVSEISSQIARSSWQIPPVRSCASSFPSIGS